MRIPRTRPAPRSISRIVTEAFGETNTAAEETKAECLLFTSFERVARGGLYFKGKGKNNKKKTEKRRVELERRIAEEEEEGTSIQFDYEAKCAAFNEEFDELPSLIIEKRGKRQQYVDKKLVPMSEEEEALQKKKLNEEGKTGAENRRAPLRQKNSARSNGILAPLLMEGRGSEANGSESCEESSESEEEQDDQGTVAEPHPHSIRLSIPASYSLNHIDMESFLWNITRRRTIEAEEKGEERNSVEGEETADRKSQLSCVRKNASLSSVSGSTASDDTIRVSSSLLSSSIASLSAPTREASTRRTITCSIQTLQTAIVGSSSLREAFRSSESLKSVAGPVETYRRSSRNKSSTATLNKLRKSSASSSSSSLHSTVQPGTPSFRRTTTSSEQRVSTAIAADDSDTESTGSLRSLTELQQACDRQKSRSSKSSTISRNTIRESSLSSSSSSLLSSAKPRKQSIRRTTSGHSTKTATAAEDEGWESTVSSLQSLNEQQETSNRRSERNGKTSTLSSSSLRESVMPVSSISQISTNRREEEGVVEKRVRRGARTVPQPTKSEAAARPNRRAKTIGTKGATEMPAGSLSPSHHSSASASSLERTESQAVQNREDAGLNSLSSSPRTVSSTRSSIDTAKEQSTGTEDVAMPLPLHCSTPCDKPKSRQTRLDIHGDVEMLSMSPIQGEANEKRVLVYEEEEEAGEDGHEGGDGHVESLADQINQSMKLADELCHEESSQHTMGVSMNRSYIGYSPMEQSNVPTSHKCSLTGRPESALKQNISQMATECGDTPPFYLRGYRGRLGSPLDELLFVIETDVVEKWSDVLPRKQSGVVKKLGEGTYGEVFSMKVDGVPSAVKIIPFEVDKEVRMNGDRVKSAGEVLPEILITRELAKLNNTAFTFSCASFVPLISAHVVRGCYPPFLLEEWDRFKEENDEERCQNERPSNYAKPDTHFLVIALGLGGVDVEQFRVSSEGEAVSLLLQLAFALVVAEERLQFEHRDLHIGNVLVARTQEPAIEFRVASSDVRVKSHGVKLSLIDFTNSRLQKEGTTIYMDLEKDEEIFQGQGDYQFDIYRLMRDANGQDWKSFTPKTNVLWMHYMARELLLEKRKKDRIKKFSATRRKQLMAIFDSLLYCDRVAAFLNDEKVLNLCEQYLV